MRVNRAPAAVAVDDGGKGVLDKGSPRAPRIPLLWRMVHILTGMMIMYAIHTIAGLLAPPTPAVLQPPVVVTLAAAAAAHPTPANVTPPIGERPQGDGPYRETRSWGFEPLHSTTCEAPVSVAKYGLAMHDIAFGILTSTRFLETRLRSQQRTWLRLIRNVVFYSESEVASLPTVPLKPPDREALVGGGAWKNFPALLDLHQRFPTHKWIFFTVRRAAPSQRAREGGAW